MREYIYLAEILLTGVSRQGLRGKFYCMQAQHIFGPTCSKPAATWKNSGISPLLYRTRNGIPHCSNSTHQPRVTKFEVADCIAFGPQNKKRSSGEMRMRMRMRDSPFDSELETASKAVQLCAQLTQKVQHQTLNSDSSISKPDFSPVTTGDFAVQALLTSALHRAYPNDTFLAEESSDELRRNGPLLARVWTLVESVKPAFEANGLSVPESPDDILHLIDLGGHNDSSDADRIWVFDPIDGTATFLRGQHYAINCAFLTRGKEQLGIIACPNVGPGLRITHDETVDRGGPGVMIFAVRGYGTWVRTLTSGGDESEVSSSSSPQLKLELAEPQMIEKRQAASDLSKLVWTDCSVYSSTILMLHQQVAARLGVEWPGVDLFSSLMKYAALGLGHADVCIRIFKYTSWRSNMWDHAGGVLIYEEAGGKVTDLDGKAIDFSRGRKMVSRADRVLSFYEDRTD